MRKELKIFVLPSIIVAVGLFALAFGFSQSNVNASAVQQEASQTEQTIIAHKCPAGYTHAKSGKHRCVRQTPRGSY